MFLIVSPLSSSLARARQKMKAFKYIIVVILNQIKRIMRKVDLVCISFRIICAGAMRIFSCVCVTLRVIVVVEDRHVLGI